MLAVFAGVYLGMMLGGLQRLQLDRGGVRASLVSAVLGLMWPGRSQRAAEELLPKRSPNQRSIIRPS